MEKSGIKLPDLYGMLGIPPCENDTAVLADAVDRMRDKAVAAESAKPEWARRAHRVVRLSEKYLLLPESKRSYDKKWQNIYGASQRVALPATARDPTENDPAEKKTAQKQPAQDEALPPQLARLLPQGDASLRFDMAKFLKETTSPSHEVLAAQFAAIESAIRSSEASPPATPPLVPQQSVQATDAAAPQMQISSDSPQKLAQKMRRKRQRPVTLMVGGILFSLLCVLAVLVVMLRGDQSSSSSDPSTVSSNPNHADAAPAQLPPRRSGLPSVPGAQADKQIGMQSEWQVPSDQMGDQTQAIAIGGDDGFGQVFDSPKNAPMMGTPAMGGDIQAALPEKTAVEGQASSSPQATGDVAGDDMQVSETPTTQISDIPLTDAQRQEWERSLSQLRELLGSLQYDEAKELLLRLGGESTSSEQLQDLQLWAEAADLAEQCHRAVVEAIENLGAAETFTVGTSTEVAFVEGSDRHLVIRMRGQSKRFAITEIPAGIVWSLVDLQLDNTAPLTSARKAVYTLLKSRQSRQTVQRAQQWLASAAAAGVVSSELPGLLDSSS